MSTTIVVSDLRHACRVLADGGAVVLQDKAVDPTQAAVVFAAARATTRVAAFAIRHTSGLLRVVVPHSRTIELDIPSMDSSFNSIEHACVAVDASEGTTTGISAADRALTARVLADTSTRVRDLLRPGHLGVTAINPKAPMMTLSAAAMHLVAVAGCGEAAVISDLVGVADPTGLAVGNEAYAFAAENSMPWLIADSI
ncbi:3,4-dihydroxy-2-butanone-4-phosphate synthase [Mycobacterium sp. BMJ-28]